MGKYKVIALSVGGIRNAIFSAGDVVTEDCFPDGHCPELVEKGFLEPIVEKEIPGPKAEKSSDPTPAKDAKKQPRRRIKK